MRAFAFALSLLLGASVVQAQTTKGTLQSDVTTSFPDNTTGLITPLALRTWLNEALLSWQQAPRVRTNATTSDTIAIADYGNLVIEGNASPVAVAVPQATGSFLTFNFYISNTGAGLVTLTPVAGNICGPAGCAGTYPLAQGQTVQLISDTSNWRVAGGGLTSAAALGANLPVIGTGTGLASGTRSGTTTAFATVSGPLTNGRCVAIDASGNLVDSGASCANAPAVTLRGNPTAGSAAAVDFTINGLTALASPDANLDYLPVWDHTAGIFKKINPGTIAAAATSGVSSLGGQTGAITCGNSLLCSGGSISAYNSLPVTTPESCGGGTGVADNLTAFQCMATFCNTQGACRIELVKNGVYTFAVANITGVLVTAFNLTTATTVVFNGNGAKMTTPNLYTGSAGCAGAATLYGFVITVAKYVAINNLWFDQSAYAVPDACAGIIGVTLVDTIQNVYINGIRMTGGGKQAFSCIRNSELTVANRAHNVFINGGQATDVFYGIGLEKNCDDTYIRGWEQLTTNGNGQGRSFIIYNVHNVELDLFTQLNKDYGSILKVYSVVAESVYSNTLQNIKVKYISRPNTTQSGINAHVTLQIDTAGGGSARLRDIDVLFDVDYLGAASGGIVFTTSSATGGVSAEFENITLRGSILSYPAGPGNIFQVFSDQNWNGAAIHNITVKDTYLNCATATCTMSYDGRGTTGAVTFKNVEGNANAAFTKSNTIVGTLDVSQGVNFPNFKSASASPSQTAWFRYLPNGYLEQGGTFSAAASANTTQVLPLAYTDTENYSVVCNNFGETGAFNASLSTTQLVVNRPNGLASCPVVWRALGRF